MAGTASTEMEPVPPMGLPQNDAANNYLMIKWYCLRKKFMTDCKSDDHKYRTCATPACNVSCFFFYCRLDLHISTSLLHGYAFYLRLSPMSYTCLLKDLSCSLFFFFVVFCSFIMTRYNLYAVINEPPSPMIKPGI